MIVTIPGTLIKLKRGETVVECETCGSHFGMDGIAIEARKEFCYRTGLWFNCNACNTAIRHKMYELVAECRHKFNLHYQPTRTTDLMHPPEGGMYAEQEAKA